MQSILLDLVGLIYDAAQDPALWITFVERYGAAINCHVAQLEHLNEDYTFNVSVSTGPEVNRFPNFDHYVRISPWTTASLKAPQGKVGLSHETIADSDYRESEYYRDFGRHIGQHYGLAGVVLKSRSAISMIGAIRHERWGPSTENDRTLLQSLLPHLARAFRMHDEFVKLRAHAASLSDCLDRLDRGFVIIDATGRLIRANQAAERMANQHDGLHISSQGLRAAISSESAALHKMIHEAAQTAAGEGLASGGSMAISRPSGRRPWVAVVSPHKTREGVHGMAAVLLIDTDQTPQPSAHLVAHLFGFTRAETHLALLLSQGIRLEDAAAQLSITINTARTHTRRMLDKAGVRRQTDLVILLNKLPRIEK